MIDIVSTGLRRSVRLANKPKQKYGLFAKFSLAVIGACEVNNTPPNQRIHELYRQILVP